MKKFLKTGKKTLSVIMAIMMLMSAWVWVAPEHASAVDAGNYSVRITWKNTDGHEFNNEFKGEETEISARAGFILYYKTNNGTGEEKKVWWDLGRTGNYGGEYVSAKKSTGITDSDSGNIYYLEATIAGFPTGMFGSADKNGSFFSGTSVIDVQKLEVYNNGTGSWVTIWQGTGHTSTQEYWYWWRLTANGDGTAKHEGKHNDNGVVTTDSDYANAWKFPTFTSTSTYTGKVDNVSVPKSGTADVMKVKVIANDQYGVQMFTPTWSVKGNVCGTTGISVDPETADETTIKLTNAANVDSNDDTQTGTITATWGNAGSFSDTFTITDTKYDVNFSYDTVESRTNGAGTFTFVKDGVKTTVENDVFHGDSVTNIPSPPSYYDNNSYYHTFKGWSVDNGNTVISSSNVPVAKADRTYIAQYNKEYKPADYTALDKAIADGKTIQNDAEYTSKYTAASRAILNQALTAFPENYKTKYGVVSQDDIDSFADAINSAISGLTLNTYNVIFLDESNAILEFYTNVQYEGSVSAPPDEDGYYDSQKHYTFAGWTLDKNTGIITDAYNSVKQDLFIYPIYTAEAHNFTKTETVTSTCIQKGATKYICDCGYSYIDGETDYGSHVWPEDYKIDIQPTCSTAGQKSKYCTECGVQGEIVVIPALGHQWGTVSPLAPATCENSGINTRLCDACGVCEHTLVPATGHTYEVKTVAATCTVKGYDEYTCKNCGHSYRDYNVDMLDHNYSTEEILAAPACNIPGVKKLTCDCGHVKTESIPALEHDELDSLEWNVIVEDTCEYAGYRTKTCSKCNNVIAAESFNDITDHDYETATTPATCTQAGKKTTSCSICGDIKSVETINSIPHEYKNEGAVVETAATCTSSAYKTYNCDNCDYSYVEHIVGSTAIAHDFTGAETIIDNATCETDGKKTVQCKNCTQTINVVIPKLGHRYGSWQVVEEATNSEDGQWKRTCANCTNVEEITIPKGGHTWDNGTVTEAATCSKAGTMVYKCTAHTDCGVTLEVTIPVTQHTVAQKVTAATCIEKGKVEAYCSVCDAECAKPFNTIETPVVPHTLDNRTEVAATCTTSGYTLYSCTVDGCDFSYKEYNENEKVKDHEYKAEETLAPTCTKEGTMTYTCACGASYTAPISPTGHNYEVAENKATCTTAGTKVYTCACGDSYTEFVSETADHNWGSWSTIQEATTDSYGIEKRECTACDAVEHRTTAPTGAHEFKNMGETPASCTQEGSIIWECQKHDNCEADYTETLDKLPHTQKLDYTAPTCISAGSSKLVCSVCDAEILSETIPATGIHDFSGEGVKVDATCTNAGTMTYTCLTDGCNETKVEAIPAKGHDLTTTVTDATCTGKGSVVITCSRCDDPTVEKTYELAAKNHSWNDGEETEAPTCTGTGVMTYTCTACGGTKTKTIPAKGHDWGEWAVTKASSNNEKGTLTRTCSRGCTETADIPAGGHNLVVSSKTEATCTAPGSVTYTCDTAHEGGVACGITVTVTLDKLQHKLVTTKKDATCTANGEVVTKCEKCDTTTITTVIPALGHSYTGEETVVKEASCLEKGEKTVKCSRCDATVTVEIPAKGHSYVAGAEVPATCTESGYIPYECACGSSYKELTSNPNGHKWNTQPEAGSVIATCVVDGKVTYKCQFCDAKNEVITPKFGHSWSAWEVVVNPTATVDGVQMRKCLRDCGATESVIIPALGGTTTYTVSFVVDGKTVATQTVNHSSAATAPEISNKAPDAKYHYSFIWDTDFTKVTSDLTVTAVFTPAAHDFGEWVIDLEANCNRDGARHRVCSCGYTESEVIPATEHDFSEIKEEKAATCTENGYKVVVCKNCGATERQTIKRLGHLMNYFEGVEATCDRDGVAAHYTCSRCGKSFEDRAGKVELTDTVIKKRYHTYVVVEGSDPTCTKEGVTDYRYCTACGYTQHPEKIPATGHADVNNDNTCDKCGATYMQGGEVVCSCRCHKNGFFNELIYKILSFFWRLFGTNKSCECGKVHY